MQLLCFFNSIRSNRSCRTGPKKHANRPLEARDRAAAGRQKNANRPFKARAAAHFALAVSVVVREKHVDRPVEALATFSPGRPSGSTRPAVVFTKFGSVDVALRDLKFW